MNFLNAFLFSGAIILGLMILLWYVSLALKNSSIVDIFWGIGFIVVAWLTYTFAPQGYLPRRQLIAVLVTIWGLRLAVHIGVRNWGKPEDFRYARWREENGVRWWWASLFKVFLLQGVLMWIISAPIVAAQTSGFPAILTPLDYLGFLLWIFGLLFESIADYQLMLFKANPSNKGKLLTTGLWKYTRHPNYFGEAALWWGFYIIALASGSWWTIFSPILMTFLLMKVSGVAMLERTLKTKPGYEEYMKKTNAFIPWFSKNTNSHGL
jgi:steroid 5-alpha reductase family enzyme